MKSNSTTTTKIYPQLAEQNKWYIFFTAKCYHWKEKFRKVLEVSQEKEIWSQTKLKWLQKSIILYEFEI